MRTVSCSRCAHPIEWKLGRRRPKYCSKSCAAQEREEARERPISDRLLAQRRITPSGCWEWTGACANNGYGRITIKNKSVGVHRVSYEAFTAPLGAGDVVCHRCDNPPCFNPEHLWIGTLGDNNRDAAAKGRSFGFKAAGQNNPTALLTDAQATEVRRLAATGIPQKRIAATFGVRAMVISNIVTGKTYTGRG